MKRHPSLRPLSDDHHRALVLARRLKRAGRLDAASLTALAREVRQEFEAQLEPHFRIEEVRLLPAMEAKEQTRLVERILQDHARLRTLVRGPWSGETANEIGKLLESHVRFEERVLFPKAEALLSDFELAAIRDAGITEETPSRPRP